MHYWSTIQFRALLRVHDGRERDTEVGDRAPKVCKYQESVQVSTRWSPRSCRAPKHALHINAPSNSPIDIFQRNSIFFHIFSMPKMCFYMYCSRGVACWVAISQNCAFGDESELMQKTWQDIRKTYGSSKHSQSPGLTGFWRSQPWSEQPFRRICVGDVSWNSEMEWPVVALRLTAVPRTQIQRAEREIYVEVTCIVYLHRTSTIPVVLPQYLNS